MRLILSAHCVGQRIVYVERIVQYHAVGRGLSGKLLVDSNLSLIHI